MPNAARSFTLLLLLLGGCSTSRVYVTTEAELRRAIPIAVENSMDAQGQFDGPRSYFVEFNFLALATFAMRVTWTPTSEPGHFRVTAESYVSSFVYLYLINFNDHDRELEFHRQLQLILGSK